MLNNVAAILGGAAAVLGDYESIQTYTVGAGGQASITFSSIPSTYKHLQVRGIARTSNTEINLQIRLNGDTGGNYMAHNLQGDGSTAGGYSSSTGGTNMFLLRVATNSTTAGTFGAGVIDVLDYANTNKNTTLRSLTGYDANGSGFINLLSGLWLNTAAVNSIQIYNAGGANLAEYSTFALYGVK